MSKLVSPEEVGALLDSPGVGPSATGSSAPARYDFRRPYRISKDLIQSIQFLHERFTQRAASALSGYLRTAVELSLRSVDQCAYSQYIAGLSNPTAFYALSLAPSEEVGALELHPTIAFAAINRMLGGAGRAAVVDRPLTDIELNVLDAAVRLLLDDLTETWKSITPITFGVRGRDTQLQAMQIASPSDIVVMLTFNGRIGDAAGLIQLAVPASLLESAAQVVSHAPPRPASPVERQWLEENLGAMSVTIEPVIETRLSGREVMSLACGDVITLGVSVSSSLDMRVSGVCKLRGRLVAQHDRAMLQIDRRCVAGAGEM